MIENLFLHAVGYGVVTVVMCVIWKCNARRWTRLARVYRASDVLPSEILECSAKRSMQTVFLVGGDIGWNSYKGIVTVGVTKKGIVLRLMPPFSLFHPPLLIPFRDSHIEPRRWYLVGKTSQFTLGKVTDVQLIVHDELLTWIESQAASLAIASE